jgi:predicted DNA-binding transcriptional regulator AlpA
MVPRAINPGRMRKYFMQDTSPPDQGTVPTDRHRLAVLTERETAVAVGLSVATLRRMRWARTGPSFVELTDKRIGYRVNDIAAGLDARTSQPTV